MAVVVVGHNSEGFGGGNAQHRHHVVHGLPGGLEDNPGPLLHVFAVVVDGNQVVGEGQPLEAVVEVDELGLLGAHYVPGLVPHLEVIGNLGSGREVVRSARCGQKRFASDALPRLHLNAAICAATALVGLLEEDAHIINDARTFGGHPEHYPVGELALGSGLRHGDAALVGGGQPGRCHRSRGQGQQ